MRTENAQFAPLEIERAEALKTIINRAAREQHAVLIEPDEEGITGQAPEELISPNENTNGLVRYRRHYRPGVCAM